MIKQADNDANLPEIIFNFTSINNLINKDNKTIVDILAIIYKLSELIPTTKKDGTQ